mmetsp:Transcript_6420/g.7200  ORF Transcript_6420/g.7200 Transcript_6420/m.7200 type:complete len:251 (-) Transcript_6420:1709-2461(-)
MRSKLSAITTLTPCRYGPLAAQSREDPLPYSLPARITSGVPAFWYSIAASKIDSFLPVGKWIVYGPVWPSPTILLPRRVFAKVPRTMIRSFPRREPYVLKSLRSTPDSCRKRAAGESFAMLPAGEMWSVVMESPNTHSTAASLITVCGSGSRFMPAKYGGLWMYVDFSSHAYSLPSGACSAFHCSLCVRMPLYTFENSEAVTQLLTTSATSCVVGQMSRRYTPFAIGSVSKSMLTRPARAYATTRGGDAR